MLSSLIHDESINVIQGDTSLIVAKQKRKAKAWKRELSRIKAGDATQYDMYLEKTRKIEVMAQRRQRQLETGRDKPAIEDIIEVNEMYIDSMWGKLELLSQIEQS